MQNEIRGINKKPKEVKVKPKPIKTASKSNYADLQKNNEEALSKLNAMNI